MTITQFFLGFFQNLPEHLQALTQIFGKGLYVVLFLIIFVETGLVVMPFLPGDSLLFAAGALSGLPNSGFNVFFLAALLTLGSILGDNINYYIGRKFGYRLEGTRWVKPEYIAKTQNFFKDHGGKSIVLARFMPIIRTYAPFIAGVGKMNYGQFLFYSVIGGITWINLFLMLGYWFGNQPVIRQNFSLVIFAIIGLSLMPAAIEILRAKIRSRRAS